MEGIKSVVNKEEIKRLQRAAVDKNKTKLADWAKQFEYQLTLEFDTWYRKQLEEAVDNLILTMVYSLHFSELTKFGNKRIKEFMDDLLETVDMFRRGEANPEDYQKQLKEHGINFIRKQDK